MFNRKKTAEKTAEKLDSIAAAVVYAGQKVGGKTGERAADAVVSTTLGRHYCPSHVSCGICASAAK